MQHRPHLVATRGQAAMVVLHLRQIAVAPFNRRGSPLERPGVLSRPRLPARQHLWFELPGARMSLEGLFNRPEDERDLSLLARTARAAELFLPVHQRQRAAGGPCPWCPFAPASRWSQAMFQSPRARLATAPQPPWTSGGSSPQVAKDAGCATHWTDLDARHCPPPASD